MTMCQRCISPWFWPGLKDYKIICIGLGLCLDNQDMGLPLSVDVIGYVLFGDCCSPIKQAHTSPQ